MRITKTNGSIITVKNDEWLNGCAPAEVGMKDNGRGDLTCNGPEADALADLVRALYADEITWDEFCDSAPALFL